MGKKGSWDLRRLFREHRIAHTRQREIVTETLLSLGSHVNAEELYARVSEREPGVGRATVYRTLQLLRDKGLVAEREFGDGRHRYEARSESHHDHLVCLACGRVVEFEEPTIEKLQEKAAAAHGFEVTHHRLELYGYCRKCRDTAADKRGGE